MRYLPFALLVLTAACQFNLAGILTGETSMDELIAFARGASIFDPSA